jgi:hypothetical protein
MNPEDQPERLNTCKFRSVEKITKEMKACCNRTMLFTDYFCEKKQILLSHPVCWCCPEYIKKENI